MSGYQEKGQGEGIRETPKVWRNIWGDGTVILIVEMVCQNLQNYTLSVCKLYLDKNVLKREE